MASAPTTNTLQHLAPLHDPDALTPPISFHQSATALPLSSADIGAPNMAAVMSGTPVPFGVQDANPYEAHILSLLSTITEHPSPSYPFPDPGTASFTPYEGMKSQAQAAIEQVILSLGKRLVKAERAAINNPFQPPSELLTPAWTPPVTGPLAGSSSTTVCPTCTRSIDNSPHNITSSATFPSTSSHTLSASLSTPTSQLSIRPLPSSSLNPTPHNILQTSNGASVLSAGPGAAGWSVRGAVGESGMTAEKELELLKAQVQDIARVCKVCTFS